MSVSVRIAIGTLLAASAIVSSVEAATMYTTQKIPTSASQLHNVALNNMAHAVGTLGDPTSSSSVVIYNWSANGSVNDPGKVIAPPPGATVMVVKGINDLSEVVGYWAAADNTGHPDLNHRRAFLYDDSTGQYTDINQPPIRTSGGDDFASEATGINSYGDVVGAFANRTTGSGSLRGFLYSHGGVVDMGTQPQGSIEQYPSPAGSIYPTAIGDAGEATGQFTAGPFTHSFIYEHGVLTDLNVDSAIPNVGDRGVDANGQDKILGNLATSTGVTECFIYSNGAVTNMMASVSPSKYQSPHDCQMRKMNNQGVTVGYMSGFGSDTTIPKSAFVYSNGTVERLDNLISPTDQAAINKVHFDDAVALNDQGQIVALAGTTYYLLTPAVSNTGTDSAVFNFEGGTQGWVSDNGSLMSAGVSSAQKFAGAQSLGMTISGTGVGSVHVPNPSVPAGQTITFHVYISGDAHIDWVQAFAQEDAAGNWNWHGNWEPIQSLQLGAWNTITVTVPANASALSSIGLQLSSSNAGGTVYLDSVDYGGSTPPPPPSDTAQYNFETDTQGWVSNDGSASVSTSAAQKFAGAKSLAITPNNTTFTSVDVPNPAAHAGQTITFHIYLPADAPVTSVQPFAQEGATGSWAWHGNWTSIQALQLGAWNTVTVNLPSDAQPLMTLGLQVSTSQPYSGTIYLDSVSF